MIGKCSNPPKWPSTCAAGKTVKLVGLLGRKDRKVCRDQRFTETEVGTNAGGRVIDEPFLWRSALLRHFPPARSRTSISPHSHSIVSVHPHALIYKHKLFQLTTKDRLVMRQKFALLISNTNFDDPPVARFQPLSISIGRFSHARAKMTMPGSSKKDRESWCLPHPMRLDLDDFGTNSPCRGISISTPGASFTLDGISRHSNSFS